jgi:hypothetical protein
MQKINNPAKSGFGSNLQQKAAKDAGFDTTAQWNAARMQESATKEDSTTTNKNFKM